MLSISSILARFDKYSKTRLQKTQRPHFENNQKIDQDFVFKIKKQSSLPSPRQIKYIKKFYSETEILATKIAFSFILISLVALGFIVYKFHTISGPSVGGEYVEALVGTPTYINPLFSQTNDVDQDLVRLIFSSLMKTDENGRLTGDLVESYEIDETEKIYTFTLKDNIKWHDKKNLTAKDVVFTINTIQNQASRSPLYITFRNIKIDLIDELTFSFTLPEPFAPFLSVLTFGILPEHLWNRVEPSNAILTELNLKPIGSGPYKFASLTKDRLGNIKSYKLERFNDYHENGPYIKTITLKFFSSFEEAKQAFSDGNSDGIGFLPQHYELGFKENGHFANKKFSLPQYTALFFNQQSNPALSDPLVRSALSLATSRHQIIESAFPQLAKPVFSPILPGFIGYEDPTEHSIFDLAQAENTLDQTSWKRTYPEESDEFKENEDQEEEINENESLENEEDKDVNKKYIREKTDSDGTSRLEITLTTVQKEENIKVAETIRNLWQSIGITVNLQIVNLSQFQKDVIKPRSYEVLLFGQIMGRDPDPYPFWHSSQANDPGLNMAMYSNKEADKLLEDARRTSNTEERNEKYAQFQKILLADMPAIFLYSLNYTYLIPNNIKGIETQNISQPSDRFSNVSSWYIKTKKQINFNK